MRRSLAVACSLLLVACSRDGVPGVTGSALDGGAVDAGGATGCRADSECPRESCDGGRCVPLPERTLAFGPVKCTYVGGMRQTVYSPVIGDFDGDRLLDVVVVREETGASSFAGTFVFFKGTGDTLFRLADVTGTQVQGEIAVATADFDGDGRLDLVIHTPSAGAMLMVGKGNGTFGSPKLLAAPSGIGAYGIALADWNGDGLPDLVRLAGTPPKLQPEVWWSAGGGKVTGPLLLDGDNQIVQVPADVDGDGRIDLLVDRWDGRSVLSTQAFFSTGGNALRAGSVFPHPEPATYADVNRDGRVDAIIKGSAPDQPEPGSVRPGLGDGQFGAALVADGPLFVDTTADFDGDGTIDLAGRYPYSPSPEAIVVRQGNGDGTFRSAREFDNRAVNSMVMPVDHLTRPRAADLDGDGRIDLWSVNGGFEWTVLCAMMNQSK